MTYLQFHAAFTLPWVLLLSGWTWRARRGGRPLAGPAGPPARVVLLVLAAHVAAALIYTTPWDNYLVARGVWGYPEGRVWFTLGVVPVEEYLFFVLQTVLTGLVLLAFLRRASGGGPAGASAWPAPRGARAMRAAGAAALLALAGAGAGALGTQGGTYLGLILVWAAPVLAGQWAFGGDLIASRWRSAVPAVLLPTFWLWLADRIAIELGIWWVSDRLTMGVEPFGLPVEEAVFFLATNLLVVFGMTMSLHPRALPRWRELKGAVGRTRGFAWKVALGAWALSMVPVPLVPSAFPTLAWVSTGLLALGTLVFALDRLGARAWLLFAVAVAFGTVVEALGSRTGVPFGTYAYAAGGPTVLGVPLFVPLGWWAFGLVAIASAPQRAVAAGAAAVLVAWDIGLDPLMVHHGFWRFEPPGIYAGVPIVNFVGWWVAGFVLVTILLRIVPDLRTELGTELRAVFVAQAFFLVFGLAYFGLQVPALVTALTAACVMASWRLGSARSPDPTPRRRDG